MYSSPPPSFLRHPALGMSPAFANPSPSHNLMKEMMKYERHGPAEGNEVDLLDARDVVHVDEVEHTCLVPQLGGVV